jgi:DegT/DnrJ/EryC1/StrS aminotransferase family
VKADHYGGGEGADAIVVFPCRGRSMISFVDLKAQSRIKEEIDAADVFENSAFILGKHLAALEEEFSAFSSTRYAIDVNSSTSALTWHCWRRRLTRAMK